MSSCTQRHAPGLPGSVPVVTMFFEGVAVAAKNAVLREKAIHLSYETDSLVQIRSDDVESFFRAPVNWLFAVMIQRPTESTR